MIRLTCALAALCLAAPAAAQDLDFDPAPLTACLAAAEDGPAMRACVGLAADACLAANGYATVVESACRSREADLWDDRLNAAYRAARDRAEAFDRDSGLPAGAPTRADALRDMQRAWIAFRDTTCAYEAAGWGGGTGAGPARAGCHLRLTAEQAIYLETGGDGA